MKDCEVRNKLRAVGYTKMMQDKLITRMVMDRFRPPSEFKNTKNIQEALKKRLPK